MDGNNKIKKVVIVGGGFAGITAALQLTKKNTDNLDVILISDKDWFDYKPGIFRVVGNFKPYKVRIPLEVIFRSKKVKLVKDTVENFSFSNQHVGTNNGTNYYYDFLILALGSEVDYHGLPVLSDMTFSANSVLEAIELNKHVEEVVSKMRAAEKDERLALGHFVIVGGGATGVEMAGAISLYAKKIAKRQGVDPSFIMVDLIESGSRVLKTMPEDFSDHVKRRLKDLDVNIIYNRRVTEEHLEEVYLKDTHIKTWSIIWAAGVRANKLVTDIHDVKTDNEGRIIVDQTLRIPGYANVFAIGDIIPDRFYGMAQTAIEHGRYVAEVITNLNLGEHVSAYEAKSVSYAVPVGPNWAAIMIGQFKLYGWIGSLIKNGIDLKFLNSIISPRKNLEILLSSDAERNGGTHRIQINGN
jgi:NADH dehydrogenase